MEPKVRKLGGSLQVPRVQELAKKALTTVPPRYARFDQDPPIISNVSSLPQIPIIDLQTLISGSSMDSELQKLHYACKEWGFFQLINHGVSSALVERVKEAIEKFFKLPMEEKEKFSQEAGDLEGYGQAFVVSEEQTLDWADLLYMVTLPAHLRKPHLFPKLPIPIRRFLSLSLSDNRDTLEEYSAELKNLGMKLLYAMAKALKMENEEVKELFEEGIQSMRMNYYPPCPQPELVMGLTPHSDGIALTILLQLNEIEGLQVKKDGMWVPVKPLPNAFIVNIGDMLEQIVTNGTYQSVEHRATVNSKKERISVATFLTPKHEGELGPARSLITAETPALFRRVSVADFLKGYFSRELRGKSYVDVMRINNQREEGLNT